MRKDSHEYLEDMYRRGYRPPKPSMFQNWRQVALITAAMAAFWAVVCLLTAWVMS